MKKNLGGHMPLKMGDVPQNKLNFRKKFGQKTKILIKSMSENGIFEVNLVELFALIQNVIHMFKLSETNGDWDERLKKGGFSSRM